MADAPSSLSSTLGLVGDRPAEEILRRLTLDVTRKLDGMLHGDFMGLVPGQGTEPGETRAYEAGDDVRRIDWNVSARMQSPYIRQTIAELEATLDQAILPPAENPADAMDTSFSVVTEDDNLLARARQLLAQNPQRARIIISSWLSTEPTDRGSKNVY